MRRWHLAVAALVLAAALWLVVEPAGARRAPDTEAEAATRERPQHAQPERTPSRNTTASLRTVEGRVVDAEGQPVAGALVSFTSAHADAVRSDAGGAFRLLNVPANGVQIFAVAKGHAARHVWWEPRRHPLTLVLAREARVRVRMGAPHAVDLLASVCHPRASEEEEPFCVGRVIVAAGQTVVELDGLPEGAHELWLEAGERVLFRLPLHTRAAALVDVEAAPLASNVH